MTAPWYVVLISLILAAPIFFLVGVFLFGMLRGLVLWIIGTEAPQGPRLQKK